ncbi:golgin subfamily A member 3-like [Gossypium australe]|uniref:Golgin subfamily A member 3-like n=1 Tax=Gossypium australe TaxID=47621 RepID=A0A5B6X1B7_9ROSI|nr:golgin subfamily A member 3-like [Gossypium australe]
MKASSSRLAESVIQWSRLEMAKGKSDVLISTPSSTKVISNVLLVSNIDQNLLSIDQLVEKNYTMVFKDCGYKITNSLGQEVVSVAMNNKSFILD